jgi:hypothetical protein
MVSQNNSSLALYPQSAIAGSNSLSRCGTSGLLRASGVEDRVLRGRGLAPVTDTSEGFGSRPTR